SCKIITPSLQAAYRQAFGGRVNYFSYNYQQTAEDIAVLAQDIYQSRPDRIVFIDHFPHPRELIQALVQLYGRKLPKIYFHVYGDFTLNSPYWWDLQEHLIGQEISFTCASHRQQQLVSHLLSDGSSSTGLCPF